MPSSIFGSSGRTGRPLLLPDNDSFAPSLRLALERLDAAIQTLHDEAAIAA